MMILNHFLAKELQNAKFLRTKLQEVSGVFEIVTVERADIEAALNSAMTAFEDAVQLSCAIKAEADFLITRNTEDFYNTNLPIILPEQFFDFV